MIRAAGGDLVLLFLVPPVVLALATRGSYGRNVWYSGYAGALIFLGYLPLAVAGTLLLRTSFQISAQPVFLAGIVIVGVIYPIVFGAIGGGLAHEVHKWRVRQRAEVGGKAGH
ncbi:hypothetical protein [Haladaptatus sp. NG-WS-4]